MHSSSASRSGTPSLHSSSSSINSDAEDDNPRHSAHSSDDDYQEAVTPSPESSPPPDQKSSLGSAAVEGLGYDSSRFFGLDPVVEKAAALEAAHLLLHFHSHIVR